MNLIMHRVTPIALLACAFVACGKQNEKEKASAQKHDENIVTLTKENLQHVDIKVEPVTLASLERTLKAAGRVTENQNKTAKISSTLEGRLIKVNVDLNDAVHAGDVLGLVQTPELLGKALEVKASIDGVIVDRKSTVGELVGKDKEIFIISDPTDLWVIAEIKERDIGGVKVGQDAAFTVVSYPGQIFHGTVTRIGNQVGAESRTTDVRIETNNAEGKLKPGMFADVEITTTVLQDVLVIPESALQADEDQQVVFVALGANKFEKRVVKTGLQHRGRVRVLDGLKAGEQVVAEGSFILKSEMLKSEMTEKD
jgi:multidrug efflux pump subunit AcrA (membrane-fusion protein)